MEGRGDVRLVSGRVQAPRLQLLFGEAAIEAESRFLVRGNRLLFTLTMPWNAYRDLSINGTLRNLVVIPGENPWIHFLARFTRMTTVGPGGRTEADEKGLIRPYRQPLFALLVEVDGPLDPARLPSYRLRNIEY
jgi:hypothetical protein